MGIENAAGWEVWREEPSIHVKWEYADGYFGVDFSETEGIVIQRWHADFAKDKGEGAPKDLLGEPKVLFPAGWKLSDFTNDELVKMAQALIEPYCYFDKEDLECFMEQSPVSA